MINTRTIKMIDFVFFILQFKYFTIFNFIENMKMFLTKLILQFIEIEM